jgi:ribosome-associated protein
LDHEVWFTYARSGGPGGQNVNKVNSKAILWWSVMQSKIWTDPDALRRFSQMFGNKINKDGLVVLSCQSERDQPSNKAECLRKLKEMVQQALTPPVQRVMTQPTVGSRERRIADKLSHKQKKAQRNFVPDYD